MRRHLFALLVLAASATPRAAAAGQAPNGYPDEAFVFEQLKTTIRFEADGTGRREVFIRARAQSEAGVRELGQLVFGYSSATERLDVPFVRVRKPDGSLVSTPASAVQDLSSPVQRIAPVYTDFRQKHITVQSIGVGDVLETSVVTVIHTALAPGHFWTEYRFNSTAIVLEEQLEIDIPASRAVILKQLPGVSATTTSENGRTRYHWTHANTVRKKVDEAEKKAETEDEEKAAVRLTSFPDWASVGAWFAGLERAARAPSPDVTAKAKALIAGRSTDIEKLEALYDYVSKSFRYVSLSLGMGRYQPRRAADVMREAYGDCKDKHTLLAALVDAAGLQASPVLMNASVKIDPDFPSPSQFNHMITVARVGGQEIWMDATPEVAPFRMLAYGLRGKAGLVAEAGTGSLKTTPTEPPARAVARTEIRGSLAENGALSADVRVTFRGDMELMLRGIFHATAKSNWTDVVSDITREAQLPGKVSAVSVSDPQATKELFSLGYHVDVDRYASVAGRRADMELPFANVEGTTDDVPPESGPIELGEPGETIYSLTLKIPAAARVRSAVPVNVSRDYGEYRAAYTVEADTLRVQRDFTLKQRELPQARRADYLAFRRVMTADAKQRIAIDGTAIAAPAVPTDAKAPDLNQSGYDALERRDYDTAIDLLKRALALDAKVPNARIYLAQAYLGRNDPQAALEVLRAQVAQNPFDEYAYIYIGRAHVALRQFGAAEAAYLKQLEVNPLDKYTPGALGAIYMTGRQYAKAAEAYEKAAALNPEQSYAQIQLGKAYLHLQRQSDAMAAFARAVELSPTASTWNSVAYELALAGFDLPRAQRYAESAVAAESAASRNLDVEHADARALGLAGQLAAHWDTLGWVYFANGNPAAAEKYVAAAWAIAQHAEVGDHLGQIYEKTDRKDAAIAAYARALAADFPDQMVREHLAAAAGDAATVEELIARHRSELAAARTFPLEGKGPRGKKADFVILYASPGAVEAVSFIEGDEEMRALAPALQKLKPFAFPESTPAKLLRRGIAACNPDGACTITLLLPDAAGPVKAK